jgi:hypothetical protein
MSTPADGGPLAAQAMSIAASATAARTAICPAVTAMGRTVAVGLANRFRSDSQRTSFRADVVDQGDNRVKSQDVV